MSSPSAFFMVSECPILKPVRNPGGPYADTAKITICLSDARFVDIVKVPGGYRLHETIDIRTRGITAWHGYCSLTGDIFRGDKSIMLPVRTRGRLCSLMAVLPLGGMARGDVLATYIERALRRKMVLRMLTVRGDASGRSVFSVVTQCRRIRPSPGP
jgi:hypothetical protein